MKNGGPPRFAALDLQWIRSLLLFASDYPNCRRRTPEARKACAVQFFKEGWCRAAVVARSTRYLAVGDLVVVQFSNGQGTRQPVYSFSSKGHNVEHFYMNYARLRPPSLAERALLKAGEYPWTVERHDNSPLFLPPEVPDEVAKLSPLDPAFSAYVRRLRAEVLESEAEGVEPPAPQPVSTLE